MHHRTDLRCLRENPMIAEPQDPMTDEQALLKAQSIWGPNVCVCHDKCLGKSAREYYMAMVCDESGRWEIVARAYYWASSNDQPISWEAMFASVQEVAK